MGYFKNISFNNYRNFINNNFNFDKGCNIILGKNGSGKTNVLEGLSLFEKGRGFRKDKIYNFENINNKDKGFVINSIFENNNIDLEIKVYNFNNLKKIYINNSNEKQSHRHFESLFSIVYFLPEMERLFISSPSLRRNFLDRLIFTYNKDFNLIINNYKKAIFERQLLLKDNFYDENWIKKIENNISKLGTIIYNKRVNHIININSILNTLKITKHFSRAITFYIKDEFLSQEPNVINDQEIYLTKLKNNRKKDHFLGGCSFGPHRSDFFGINNDNNLNLSQLSTGQQKTVIILIIIAQCLYLLRTSKFNPIILLDEICSHLDSTNRELILYLIKELNVQSFMTGTDKSFFSFLSTKVKYCNIS